MVNPTSSGLRRPRYFRDRRVKNLIAGAGIGPFKQEVKGNSPLVKGEITADLDG